MTVLAVNDDNGGGGSGSALVDGTTQDLVAKLRSTQITDFISKCVSGRVILGSLGFGTVRQAVLDFGLTLVDTYEARSDVITFAGVGGGSGPGPVTNASVIDAVHYYGNAIRPPWDHGSGGYTPPTYNSAVFDLDPTSAYEDATFRADLQLLLPNLGNRVVVLSARPVITLPGFRLGSSTLFDGTYVHLFDNISVASGYVANPFGTVLNPGFGWH